MLDDASYPLLWQLAIATHTPPEFFVAVMTSESGLNASVPNQAGASYYGLNQISGKYLKAHGVTPSDYLTWAPSQQLSQIVIPYFKGIVSWLGRPIRSPGVLYGLNFYAAPLKKSDSPDTVIVSKPGNPIVYNANVVLDFDKSGEITVQDLDDMLNAKVIGKQPYQAAYDKLYSMVPANWVPPVIAPVVVNRLKHNWIVVGLSVGLGVAGAVWMRSHLKMPRVTTRNSQLAYSRNPARTFGAARKEALDALAARGWTVKRDLKVPWAESPDQVIKLYFKAQAIYYDGNGGSLNTARSTWIDIRAMSGEEFVAKIDNEYKPEFM